MKSLSKFPSKAAAVFDPAAYAFDVRKQVAAESDYDGDVGIEIELEGENLPQGYGGPTTNGITWVWHNDGSLRGGAEYVSSAPIKRADLPKMLDDLFAYIAASGGVIKNSNRCSTHVHLNMKGAKLNQIAAFVSLYGCFESVLSSWCGPVREGNLFALRLEDCHYAVDGWKKCFVTGDFDWPNEMRYLALNPAALRKFGSLEVRTMGGVTSGETVVTWVDALLRLKQMAVSPRFKDPAEIAMTLSSLGGRGFFDDVFGDLPFADEVCRMCGDDIEMTVRSGFRRIQPIIYSVSWAHALPEIEKVFIPRPFGEPPRKKKAPAALRMRTAAPVVFDEPVAIRDEDDD